MRSVILLCCLIFTFTISGQSFVERYKVKSVYIGRMAPIDFKSNLIARVYKTRISEHYKTNGVNFAGHYSFVFWGCGSPCESSAIVDVITGKVYSGPDSAFGYRFNRDSRYVVVNQRDSVNDNPWTAVYPEERWCWSEKRKKFVQLN